MISTSVEPDEISAGLPEHERHWAITTRSGHTVTGYLPSWA